MKYQPIKIQIEDEKYIEFYFTKSGKYEHWFYEIHDVRNEKEIKEWDEHLQSKMWYTPEVREKTMDLMYDLVGKRNRDKANEEDYRRTMGLDTKYISPKQRKANQVKWTYKYGDKEIKHLTSKQLGAMLKNTPKLN